MLRPIDYRTWAVLRQALRTPGCTGHELRLDRSRATKGGGFLAELVRVGLLEVVTPAPGPFETTYCLTAAGEHAAEYGEYEFGTDRVAAPPKNPDPKPEPPTRSKP